MTSAEMRLDIFLEYLCAKSYTISSATTALANNTHLSLSSHHHSVHYIIAATAATAANNSLLHRAGPTA